MKALLNRIYALSNSIMTVHFEKNIQYTELGKHFNKKLCHHGINVVVSTFTASDEYISLNLKIRGITGGHFGRIASYIEDNIEDIHNPFCQIVFNDFIESIHEMNLPCILYYEKEGKHCAYKLSVSTMDFNKRSCIGFFMDNIVSIQNRVREKFQNVSFIICFKDDDEYFYYLIFSDNDEQNKAEKLYGIQNMINYVYEICKSEDEYGVFQSIYPKPIVTNKIDLRESGRVMSVLRDNPDLLNW